MTSKIESFRTFLVKANHTSHVIVATDYADAERKFTLPGISGDKRNIVEITETARVWIQSTKETD